MSPRQIGLLAALSAVWGGSYLLIKYALEDLEPAVIVWVRLVLAAVVLYGDAAARRRRRGAGRPRRAARPAVARAAARHGGDRAAVQPDHVRRARGPERADGGPDRSCLAVRGRLRAADRPEREGRRLSARRHVARAERRRAVRRRRVGALDLGVPRRARDGRRGRLLRALELRGQALQGPDLGDGVVHLDPRRRRADAAGGGRHRAGFAPGHPRHAGDAHARRRSGPRSRS